MPRTLRTRRRVNYRAIEERYARYSFKTRSNPAARRAAGGCVRYSGSAPPRSHFAFALNGEPTNLPSAVGWIDDIETNWRWDIALNCIRLAYFNMTGTQQAEGRSSTRRSRSRACWRTTRKPPR